MKDLGTFGGKMSWAKSIDDMGRITGWSENYNGEVHPCLWLPTGEMIDLGTLGGKSGWAYASNLSGQVVGGSEKQDGYSHAFIIPNIS